MCGCVGVWVCVYVCVCFEAALLGSGAGTPSPGRRPTSRCCAGGMTAKMRRGVPEFMDLLLLGKTANLITQEVSFSKAIGIGGIT